MNASPRLGRGPDPNRIKVDRAADKWFALVAISREWRIAVDEFLAACADLHLENIEPTRGSLGRELDTALAMRRGDVPFWDREAVA